MRFRLTSDEFSEILSERGIWNEVNEEGKLVIESKDIDRVIEIASEMETGVILSMKD